MKRKLLLLLSSVVITFVSCKKQDAKTDTTATQGIQGTYKLKYITVKNNGTLTSLNQKTVNVAQYTTINNGGTVVIDASKVTATSLTYEVNSTQTSYIYTDNALADSMKSTFTLQHPASNFSTSYKLVGTDSIYFPQGSPASDIFASSMPGAAYGGKYNLSGNVLTIIQTGSKDSSFQVSGLSYSLKATEVASMVMEKQ
jgi:hypothetical protein